MGKREGCKALRYFDVFTCTACNKQWDVDEEPPECTPPVESQPIFKETLRLRQSKMVAELRRNLSDKKD